MPDQKVNKIRTVFAGTPSFAIPSVDAIALQNEFELVGVYTQPDKPAGRGKKIVGSAVKRALSTFDVPIFQPNSLTDDATLKTFRNLRPELFVVAAYGLIIPEDFLKIPRYCINVHASLLPRWRGAAPIQRAIINLDKKTGISVMKINNELDSGPVCNKYEIEIKKQDNSETISEKLSLIASEKILDEIDNIIDGKANFIEQEHDKATYANKIEKTEGKINWNIKAEEILGLINGLFPSPGAWFTFKGERYKILKAEVGNSTGEPGIVLNENLEVGCKERSLKIIEIQREGKKVQKIGEFMLGSQIRKGSIISNV